MINVVSLSGGKDSVALWLWARRTGLDPVAIYDDTIWEWEGHAAYLAQLEELIGPIRRCRPEQGFAEVVRRKGTFPSRVRRWCTEELKIWPFREELDRLRDETGDDVVVLLGIRRDESPARAMAQEREWAEHYDCEVWRPILDWTIADVAAEHHAAGVPMHPLYHLGAERVGCFPCVGAPKAEIALVARIQPSRIDEIRALEEETGQTMFTRDRRAEKRKAGGEGPSVEPIGIDKVVEWARTERGGKRLALVPQVTGCAKWGVCEAAPEAVPSPPPPKKPKTPVTPRLIRWAGGKSWLAPDLVPDIAAHLQRTGGTYVEPFLGGGAIAIALGRQSPQQPMFLSDAVEPLIQFYTTVRDQPGELAWQLSAFGILGVAEEDYYRVRDMRPEKPLERAARFLYLSCLGFNGLYRENKAGDYNVPFGDAVYRKSVVGRSARDSMDSLFPNKEKIHQVSDALKNAELWAGDFAGPIEAAGSGDLVFCDPPYAGTFDQYSKDGFSQADQERLAEALYDASQRGVAIVACNADVDLVRYCYGEWAEITVVKEQRRISNTAATKRPRADCVLITSGL